VSGKRVYLLIVAMAATLFVLAACSEVATPTQEPVEFNPTAATSANQSQESEPTSKPAEAPAAENGGGDAEAGRALYVVNCSGCHSTDDSPIVGPGFTGVYARAATRTDLDADAYIEQSLRDPSAFVVEGFPAVMSSFNHFSDEEVQNIIAFLKTVK
jgi:cytochrome c2